MINKFKNFFNNKNTTITYIILLFAVIVSIFSQKESFNYWQNILDNLYNTTSNMIIIIFYLLITNKYAKKYTNINILLRTKSEKIFLKKQISEIILLLAYITFIYYILICAGSIFISFGDFETTPAIIIKIILKFITNGIIIIEMVIILHLATKNNKKNSIICIAILIILALIKNESININQFYQMPLNPITHLGAVNYNSYVLLVICTLLEAIILTWVIKIEYSVVTKKKRDILC